MGLFDFLFSSGVSNSQKKAHSNAGNNTFSDHENYTRGYEDGYDVTVAVTMIVLTMTIMIVVIVIAMSMKVARMMSAMTIIVVGSYLLKMDFSHYYIIRL